MEPYRTFFVPFDSTKLNFFNINDLVKNIVSSSDKKKEAKDKYVAPIFREIALTKESIKIKKVTNGKNLVLNKKHQHQN